MKIGKDEIMRDAGLVLIETKYKDFPYKSHSMKCKYQNVNKTGSDAPYEFVCTCLL